MFPDPDQFDPQRFIGPPDEYSPFGFDHHHCIAGDLVVQLSSILVEELVHGLAWPEHTPAAPQRRPPMRFASGPPSEGPAVFVLTEVSTALQIVFNSDDGDSAAKIIQDALGIESDDVANYVFPKTWPTDREQRARIIGEWLQTEARFLA